MEFSTFKLEEYLGKYEFSAPYLLCCSDAESFSMQEIIDMAGPEERDLWRNLRLGYTEVKGMPALRRQITTVLYPTLQADNILCFAGAEEGIFCALMAICQPNDHIIVITPCYQSLLEIPRMQGCKISEVMLREGNEWRIDIDEIKKQIKSNTKAIIINFPHNPTGQVIDENDMDTLISLCKTYNLWLFSDEVYRLLGQPKHGWAKPAAELYEKALSLGVMSKAYGMAGLRVGWIACANQEILKKIEFIKHYTSICNSASSEVLALIALKSQDKILARNNRITAENLGLLEQFINRYQDLFSWVKPQGGCVGFVKYYGKEGVDNFAKNLVEQTGVLIMPASIYNYNGSYFRIGFGRQSMPEALRKLEDFIQK